MPETGALPKDKRALLGLKSASRQYWALNNLAFMATLLIQFGLGMWINLFVGVPAHHPGAGSANFFSGAFHSLVWSIGQGPIVLAIHSALGLGVAVHSIHNTFWNIKWGTRGSAWAAGLGAVFVWAAGVSGAVFLIHNKDLSSFLMALFFGAAMLSYATLVFLLMHAPETETAAPRATATT